MKQYLTKLENINQQYLQSARQSIELLDTLVVELSTLDPDEAVWVEGYLAKKTD